MTSLENTVKRLLCAFWVCLNFSSFLSADTIFTCASKTSNMIFSSSNVSGKSTFDFESTTGSTGFSLMGQQLTVEKTASGYQVSGHLVNHDHYTGFVATFPSADGKTSVSAILRLTDLVNEPLIDEPYTCEVQEVQS